MLEDQEEMGERLGSPGYAAPEIYTAASYNEKADLFSTGVVLYFAVTGKLPFHGSSMASTIQRTLRVEPGFDATVLGSTTARCRDFITQLMRKAPEERPGAKEALRSAWVSGRMTCRVLQHPTSFGLQRGASWHADDARARQCHSFPVRQDFDEGADDGAVAGVFGRQFRAASGRDPPWPLPEGQAQPPQQPPQAQRPEQRPPRSPYVGRSMELDEYDEAGRAVGQGPGSSSDAAAQGEDRWQAQPPEADALARERPAQWSTYRSLPMVHSDEPND